MASRPLRDTPTPYRTLHHDESLGTLLARASQRDGRAWDELVGRFGRLVLHSASRVGLTPSDAADAAQLTWICLLKHAHQIRDPERLPAWLATTARRESVRVAIAKRRDVLYANPADQYDAGRLGAMADTYPVEGDFGPAVEEALGRLPPQYRRLLRVLMADDCPSYVEVSRRLGIPIGSIGPMRSRALGFLRSTPEFTRTGFRQLTAPPARPTGSRPAGQPASGTPHAPANDTEEQYA